MPRLDGTGPLGEGPRTGFGRGNCPSDNVNSNQRNNFGRGLGICYNTPNDKESLLAQKVLLEKRLAEIEAQLKKLGE